MALSFDKLKSIFIVSDDEEQTTENKDTKDTKKTEETKNITNKTTPQDNTSYKTTIPPVVNISNSSTGAFNQKVFDSLTKALNDANLPGEDYIEFVTALNAMKDLPLDDNLKMQTVLATLSTKGLTISKIIETADYYVKILDNEKEKFNTVVKSQIEGVMGKKQQDITALEQAMKNKAEQIKILTEEITKSQEEIIRLKNEIQDSDSKIQSTVNDFNFTFNLVQGQIINNTNKIKTLQK